LVETFYFLVDLEKYDFIKLDNLKFVAGQFGHGKEFEGKQVGLDKLFNLVKDGYLPKNSFAQIYFDITIKKDPTLFIKAQDGQQELAKNTLGKFFKSFLFDWRCLVCGYKVKTINNLKQLHYYLNGFTRNIHLRCENRKHKHMNWFEIIAEEEQVIFYSRFYATAETVTLRLPLSALLLEQNKYLISKKRGRGLT
jgi:hypothetical protein